MWQSFNPNRKQAQQKSSSGNNTNFNCVKEGSKKVKRYENKKSYFKKKDIAT